MSAAAEAPLCSLDLFDRSVRDQLPEGTWTLDPETSDYLWSIAKWEIPAVAAAFCNVEVKGGTWAGVGCGLIAVAIVFAIDSYKIKPKGKFQFRITITDKKILGFTVGKDIQVEILPVETSSPTPPPTTTPTGNNGNGGEGGGAQPTTAAPPTTNPPSTGPPATTAVPPSTLEVQEPNVPPTPAEPTQPPQQVPPSVLV
ncbi:hypothetical protein [Nocardia otitidiscaviarum]|uniref:hypothetical protein n=1 Tax=Nocardia otitidiscaviarum TaxID=1823 RepID=UPI002456509C|nr:hypothetical protein [Nocardia otitidiscaviarum]